MKEECFDRINFLVITTRKNIDIDKISGYPYYEEQSKCINFASLLL